MSDIIPKNGWGQAAVNNTNGFGKAASNATNGWGTIHARTWGHPTTNLTGTGVFPLDGLMWSQIFNNAYATHSGTGLNFVAANGDYVQLSETITLTGDWSVSFTASNMGANNFIASGVRTRFEIKFLGNNIIVRSGINTYFNGSVVYDTNINTYDLSYNSSNSTVTVLVNGVQTEVIPQTGNDYEPFEFDYLSRYGNGYYNNNFFGLKLTNGNGQTHTFDFFQTAGNTLYPREYATTGLTGTINGATPITGSTYGEQLYNWGYNMYTTGGVLDNINGTVLVTGATSDAVTDVLGNTIARPSIDKVYNAPNNGVNNYAQLEQTANTDIDTSGEVTIGMWYYTPKREASARYFVHNEQFGIVAASNNAILVEVGGQYVATLGIFEKEAEWEMLFFTVNASGVVNAYRADENNEPVAYGTPNQSGAGTPTAGTFPMYANNSNPAGSPIYSYNQVTGFWNKILTLDEMKDAWNATKDISVFFLTDDNGNLLVDNNGNNLII